MQAIGRVTCSLGTGQHSAELMLTVVMSIALNRVWHSRANVCSRGEMAGWKGVALSSPRQTVRIYGITHSRSWTGTPNVRCLLGFSRWIC